jgi:hypothetical protein
MGSIAIDISTLLTISIPYGQKIDTMTGAPALACGALCSIKQQLQQYWSSPPGQSLGFLRTLVNAGPMISSFTA